MDTPESNEERWSVLTKNDDALLKEIQSILSNRALGDPYNSDGSFANGLASLPVGLRAMAVTHWLDISLTLDSITWHFGNFGERHLVALTEEGLEELGLHELGACFREAKELMKPLLEHRTESDGDLYEILERNNLRERGEQINKRTWALDNLGRGKSLIYNAWIVYARKYPERVFNE